ncbi:MAG: putative methyltransferase [Parcubacteria group bacterium GW2011_GWB1_57_6]|nr:MAG: putative methyltransferase [Parcubacteria group bacterium GW2011_GWA1_56_13]KKW45673.1 MAG: putative methyltransferase [Parcubacteria group bacterium GW2011_GWB1_57_6]
MIFDRKYYEDLWGTIHRHAFYEAVADWLEKKYGVCKILDIGTGCGYLVKLLRERGFDAWGIEVSDYALEHTCAKGYVLKASVETLPFADGSFDLVHAISAWEYVLDVKKAWSECKRVGKKQHHSINYRGSVKGERDFLNNWTEEEWNKIMR